MVAAARAVAARGGGGAWVVVVVWSGARGLGRVCVGEGACGGGAWVVARVRVGVRVRLRVRMRASAHLSHLAQVEEDVLGLGDGPIVIRLDDFVQLLEPHEQRLVRAHLLGLDDVVELREEDGEHDQPQRHHQGADELAGLRVRRHVAVADRHKPARGSSRQATGRQATGSRQAAGSGQGGADERMTSMRQGSR